jgi:uncharacterized secreted repeat protein (TIGR03808 family)
MVARRTFLLSLGAAAGSALLPARARDTADRFAQVDLRGAVNAELADIGPGAAHDQSARINSLLREAAAAGQPVFLPPGTYHVSGLVLPDQTRLIGIAGATRLVYGGDGTFMTAHDAARIHLSGLVIDGANRWLSDDMRATFHARNVARIEINDCEFLGSRRNAVMLEACGGRIERSRLSGAQAAAIYAVESTGLTIRDNEISDCANGGILVHRWQVGTDNSIVTGNRIVRIAARDGGTGQYGNGINVFRADNVMIANNHVSDCAFSAIRSNSGSNIQIVGNQCHRAGETAIYSEFAFEGAIIASNLVDGAANGISVANFNEGGRLATVANNIVRNITAPDPYPPEGPGFGWGIAVEADTAVTGNTVDTVAKWGMLVGWGPFLRNVAINANIVRNAPVGMAVSVVEDAGPALIAGNIIQNAAEGAVVGFRWGAPTTADLAAGTAGRHAHLTVERNTVS